MVETQNATTVQVLEGLLARGALAPQYEAYINANIRNGKDSFYTRLLAKEGKDAAEASLAEWNRRDRMSDYAATIEPVVRGMLAMAKVDTAGKYTRVVDASGEMEFPRHHYIDRGLPSRMVVVFNYQAPGCGCNQPEGSDDWGLHGRLGLKAVTLHAGNDRFGKSVAQLGLVFPLPARSREDFNDAGYNVATIDLEGHTNGNRHSPSFCRDGYLMYSLRQIGMERAVMRSYSSGGHFDDAVGFPGATDYLANALPNLGAYFAELATKLSSDHKH